MKSNEGFSYFDELPRRNLLRPEEVAGFLDVSPRTIYRWHEIGIIEGTRMNHSLRIFRDSVVKRVNGEKTCNEDAAADSGD